MSSSPGTAKPVIPPASVQPNRAADHAAGKIRQVQPVLSGWVRDILISLAVSAFFIIFLYQPVKVEGTSMMPGLADQERIFINPGV